MSSLGKRVARIEKKWGGSDACPVCRGQMVLRVKLADDPDPEGCPGCGKISKLVVLCRGTPPEGWEPRKTEDSP